MPESTVEPQTIKIDSIKNGKVNMLVHWDIEYIERTDDTNSETQNIYIYEECAFRGTNGQVLPYTMTTYEEVETYLYSIENEILDWAKGSKVTL